MFGKLPRNLRSFSVVGAVGFAVDATLLSLLTHAAGWTPWQARIPSFMTAVLVTWVLNRRYTFSGRGLRDLPLEALLYGAIQACGAAINLVVFGICLLQFPRLASYPVIPFAVGSAVALGFNFAALNGLLYARPRADSK